MSFYIKLVNYPYGISYWIPSVLWNGELWEPEYYLQPHQRWSCPINTDPTYTIDLRVVIYDKDKTIIEYRDIWDLTVRRNGSYTYDWGADSFEEVAPPPPPVEEYRLTVSCEPAVGRIEKKPDKDRYSAGDVVKLTAYILSQYLGEYEFESWYINGEWLDNRNPTNLMIEADHHVTAQYARIEVPEPTPPPHPPPTGQIEKPVEVRSWLAKLNYEILGIGLYIGDWIEYAIDLVLGWVNTVLGIAEEAVDFAEGIAGTLTDEIDRIWAGIDGFLAMLVNLSNSLYDIIAGWWEDTKLTVLGWIETATQGLGELKAAWDNFWEVTFPGYVDSLEGIWAAWDDFRRYTLPSLVSISWLTDWWSGKLPDIDDLVTGKLKDWFPFYNDLVELWDGIVEFFTDPEKWLYEALDRIIDRFW